MARTTQEVFEHHVAALVSGDMDELMADYADDAVLLLGRTENPSHAWLDSGRKVWYKMTQAMREMTAHAGEDVSLESAAVRLPD